MRILLVSDLHYTLRQLDWVDDAAPAFDVVVVAGDHLDISSAVPPEVQIVAVTKHFARLARRTRLIVCSGNHDLTGRDANGEHAAVWLEQVRAQGVATDGDVVELGDVRITVCPWWDGPLGREAVNQQLARDAVDRPPTWIWVYHWPPATSPTTWTGRRFYGDADLAGWIGEHQPDLVFTGHVHQSPFAAGGSWSDRLGRTWVFNAGRQIGPVPTHVVIDLAERVATWWSYEGEEERSLDEPPRQVARAVAP